MQELWFLHSAHCLMLIDIYMKFLKISWTGFKLQSWHDFVMDKVPREITSINARIMVVSLCPSSMLVDIHMKFREESLNGIQVTDQTRFCDRVQGK